MPALEAEGWIRVYWNFMDSLAHWDYAVQFSGYEAAALILGIDPGKPDLPKWNESPIKAIYDRMALHYGHALKRHYFDAFNMELSHTEAQEMETYRSFELASLTLNGLCRTLQHDQEDTNSTDWLTNDQRSAFGNQAFSREAIADWLTANGLDSVYQFALDDSSVRRKNHWPWGDYSTVMLEHLEAAAKKFWVLYDTSDPSTAHTNEEVIDWLEKKRGMSRKKAEAIASILRADDLPHGPRRK